MNFNPADYESTSAAARRLKLSTQWLQDMLNRDAAKPEAERRFPDAVYTPHGWLVPKSATYTRPAKIGWPKGKKRK